LPQGQTGHSGNETLVTGASTNTICQRRGLLEYFEGFLGLELPAKKTKKNIACFYFAKKKPHSQCVNFIDTT
jgi:hypothetical protein